MDRLSCIAKDLLTVDGFWKSLLLLKVKPLVIQPCSSRCFHTGMYLSNTDWIKLGEDGGEVGPEEKRE